MRAALALTAVLSTACASVPVRHVGERRVDDPSWVRSGGLRVRYVGELQGPEHLGIEPSTWKRFWSWLVGEREATALSRPFALGFAADGRIAVADPGNRAVRVYDAARHQHLRLTEGLSAPLGVAFVGELLVVADAEARTLRGFDVEGAPVALPWKLPLFGRPVGLAWDAVGQRLFVGDAVEHCVHVLSASGAARLGLRGSGPGEFNFPTHLAWGGGQLYVTDSLNFRVQVFDAELHFVRELGGLGDTPGDLPRPKGVAVDARGTVWVVEGSFDAVQAFDTEGELVAVIGGAGTTPGRFWLPAGAAIDGQGQLFVADTWNARVQVFALEEAAP